LIQGGSEIVYDVADRLSESRWQRLNELDLVRLFVFNLRIDFNRNGLWYGLIEELNLPIEIKNVSFARASFRFELLNGSAML
jgi:hypothetical protein